MKKYFSTFAVMVNINEIHTELIRRGKSFTYVKVRRATRGVPNTTTEGEKKDIISVLDKLYKDAKEKILKS